MPELDFGLEVALGIGNDVKSVKRLLQKSQERKWTIHRLAGVVKATGAGTVTIDLGSPVLSRIWAVTSIAVFNADDTKMAPTHLTRVGVCVGQSANPGIAEVVAVLEGTTSESFSEQFGTDAIWCQANENLYCQLIVDGAATFAATATVRSYFEDAVTPDSLEVNG